MMHKKILLLLLFVFWVLPAFAQVDTAWVRRYNGPGNGRDEARAIAVDDSGNAYVTGHSLGGGTQYDYATIKYNPNGDIAWVRRYNGPGDGGDWAHAVTVDDSGKAYVTGKSQGDYATIKYYPNGDTAWLRTYDGPGGGDDEAYAIAIDDSGCVYVTGKSSGSGTSYDYATIKYYSNGDTAWVRRYNGPVSVEDEAFALAVDDSGNVYVTGASGGDTSFLGCTSDYATIKYDPSGNQVWASRYDRPGMFPDSAFAIAVDDSGNVYVTGYSYDSATYQDYATIKYYPNGDTAWVRRYYGPGNSWDEARAIAVDDSGNVYVTGFSTGDGTDYDYATMKYSANGETSWVRRYDGPASGYDAAYALTVHDPGNVCVTGVSWGGVGSKENYTTIKYGPSGSIVWLEIYDKTGNASGGGICHSRR